jgi:CRP/FNR family transcriptional regulator
MNNILKSLFPSISSALLEEIAGHAVSKSFVNGDVIMRTGQYITNTVMIVKVRIKIYREDEDGGEFFMYYLLPGQACAVSMICAIKNEKSQIMAKVVEDVDLIMVPLSLMDKWMMQHRSWYEFVIDTYRSRFEEVLQVVNSIAFRAMDERLEFYIKRHLDACGCNDLKLSHQDIATELNTSREVISRLLKKLEQQGKLKLHRNHIEIIK